MEKGANNYWQEKTNRRNVYRDQKGQTARRPPGLLPTPGQQQDRQHQQKTNQEQRSSIGSGSYEGLVSMLSGKLDLFNAKLDSLNNRIGYLERGPDKPRQSRLAQPPLTKTKAPAGPPHTTPQEGLSKNTNFALASKYVFRLVQLEHHLPNWTVMPKTIQSGLDKLVSNIKPPGPDAALNQELDQLKADFAAKIQDTVSKHIKQKIQEITQEMRKTDNSDLDRIKCTVRKYVDKSMGTKISADRKEALITQAGSCLGADFVRPLDVQRRHPDVRTMTDVVKQVNTNPIINKVSSEVRIDDTETDDEGSIIQSTPKRGRSDSTSTPNRPTKKRGTPRMRPPASSLKVHHNKAQSKGNWKLIVGDKHKTVVLGDSNLRLCQDMPEDWQLDCYPGSNLKDVTKILGEMKPSDNLETIILHVGINDRASMFTGGLPEDFLDMVNSIQERKIKIVATGIPYAHLPEKERANVEHFNLLLKGLLKEDFIEALDKGKVKIKQQDPHKIHFTEATAALLVESMVSHLNC